MKTDLIFVSGASRMSKVNALCVEGDEGFLAFFYVNEMLHIASGDDGDWKLIFVMRQNWVKEFKRVVSCIPDKDALEMEILHN